MRVAPGIGGGIPHEFLVLFVGIPYFWQAGLALHSWKAKNELFNKDS
jgi:hypothetical protein